MRLGTIRRGVLALGCALALGMAGACATERARLPRARGEQGAGTTAGATVRQAAAAPGAAAPAAAAPGAAPASPSAPYRDPASLAAGQIVHAPTGRLVSQAELLAHLAHFPVVYVGETHDSVEDHRVQLAVLRGLHERGGGTLVLGMEMLERSHQAEADAFVRGELDEAAFRKLFDESWGSWDLYAGILRFARETGTRLLALRTEARLTDAVKRHDLARLPDEIAASLPDMDLDDPHHRAYVRAVFSGHGHGASAFEAFYRVQVLWEETMAETAARLLERAGGGARLVVLAGAGHVRFGFGIPRRLFRRLPVPYAIVLPVHVQVAEAKRDRAMDVSLPALPLPAADFQWAVRYE